VTPWSAPTATAAVDAVVEVPGSKSMTNRALVLAALSEGHSVISHPLDARDTRLMATALEDLGARVATETSDWSVAPGSTETAVTIQCGLAGTVMRFVPPVAALTHAPATFVGDDQARTRPLAPLLRALAALGVEVAGGPALPFVIGGRGRVQGGEVALDASASSQFVSALLLAGARFDDGVTLLNSGRRAPNRPHIAMTTSMLARHGVEVQELSGSTEGWRVDARPMSAHDWAVEPDLSNATPFFAAAMVTGGRVRVIRLGGDSVQPVEQVAQTFTALGADVSIGDDSVTVTGDGRVRPVQLDLRDLGELAPTVTALAMLADGPSRITGIEYLRGHETDRLAALSAEAERIGGRVDVADDGLVIHPRPLHGGTWHTYRDHRMATAGAILGLLVPGVAVDDIATTAKTMPEFPLLWERMLAAAA
jgi:3-phosphoshikimate 1-carboxyvinyltransferase